VSFKTAVERRGTQRMLMVLFTIAAVSGVTRLVLSVQAHQWGLVAYRMVVIPIQVWCAREAFHRRFRFW
jgi:hypothetical protein